MTIETIMPFYEDPQEPGWGWMWCGPTKVRIRVIDDTNRASNLDRIPAGERGEIDPGCHEGEAVTEGKQLPPENNGQGLQGHPSGQAPGWGLDFTGDR